MTESTEPRTAARPAPHRGALAVGLLLTAAFAALGKARVMPPAAATAPSEVGVSLPSAPGTRRPTFVLFQNGASSIERQFLASLRRDGADPDRDDLRVVLIDRLDGAIARRFALHETPTLLVMEPGGREIGRRVGPQAIASALAASGPGGGGANGTASAGATCRVWRGPRLRWVNEDDPRARCVYRRFGGGQWGVPDIFKAMSLRPDLMEKALDLSEKGHFADGYLDRRTKERIATFVSGLNGSHYCVGSHAGGLRELGARDAEVAALARGDLAAAALSPREQALFEFLRRLTLTPGEVKDEDIVRLREKGWRDEQIFEATFDASLFALFNRVAITYGLDYPPDGWKPSSRQLRAALPLPKERQ